MPRYLPQRAGQDRQDFSASRIHTLREGEGRSSVFSLSDKARDVDLQVGSDIYNGYYLYRRGIIYDNILILRLYFSNLIQIVR